jgi:two-component system, OmpR family, sensor histidine kinase KdpD
MPRYGAAIDRHPTFRLIGRHIVGLSIIVLVTLVYGHGGLIGTFINPLTVGFVLLLAILCASTLWGLSVAMLMSFAATLMYDFFVLPPVGTFNISDRRNWVALGAFLATSVIGSYLAARARRDAKEANRRRREAEELCEFSQRLLCDGNPDVLLETVPRHIAESFKVGAVTLSLSDNRQIFHWGLDDEELEAARLRVTTATESAEQDLQAEPKEHNVVMPLRLGGRKIGSISLARFDLSEATIQAIAALIEVAVERIRTLELAGKIEAARENERLKSVLLDAITHDFRTPLTSIKGSATGLLANIEFTREQRKDLLLIIDEECDRIDELVGEVSEISRLEAGQVQVELAPHSVGELIAAALSARKSLLNSRLIVSEVKDPDLQVLADLSLSQKVLLHLIDNADLYSSEGQPITLSAEERNGFAVLSVSDRGPGIREAEMAQIFATFYRGNDQRHRVPGTGMGLAIAKGIVELHGGSIEAVSRLGEGSVFTFTLPLATRANVQGSR